MNEPMVPRYEPNICDCSDGAHLDWCESPDGYVRNSDAALLESVVRAADEMRKHSLCDCAGCEVVPGSCALCRAAHAYDAARGKVKP